MCAATWRPSLFLEEYMPYNISAKWPVRYVENRWDLKDQAIAKKYCPHYVMILCCGYIQMYECIIETLIQSDPDWPRQKHQDTTVGLFLVKVHSLSIGEHIVRKMHEENVTDPVHDVLFFLPLCALAELCLYLELK